MIDEEENSVIVPQNRFEKEMEYKTEDLILHNKLKLIRAKAKKMEEEAHIKEKSMKWTKTSVKMVNEINGMLIDSINAKLHILEGI